MLRPRLLVSASLLFCCAGLAFAQSQSVDSGAGNSKPSPSISSLGESGANHALNPPSRASINGDGSDPNADPIKANSQSRKQLLRFLDAQRNGFGFVPGSDLHSDAACFAIRSFLVVRDDPHSDTTHRDGSTTCVPAARFKVYSTVDQAR